MMDHIGDATAGGVSSSPVHLATIGFESAPNKAQGTGHGNGGIPSSDHEHKRHLYVGKLDGSREFERYTVPC